MHSDTHLLARIQADFSVSFAPDLAVDGLDGLPMSCHFLMYYRSSY